MLIKPTLGELLEQVDCSYTLAVEAAKRAREIIDGSNPKYADAKPDKPLSTAIEEINRGLITYARPETVNGEDGELL